MAPFQRAAMTLALGAAVTAGVCVVGGCDEQSPANANILPVTIAGKKFYLEVAATDAVRMKGMGGRTHIEEDGGMIFAFAPSDVRVMGFVMRDCPIPMDIMYLDGAGRVLTTYTMQPEEPRKADGSEGKEADWNSEASKKYDARLKQYSSRFPCHYVIELKEGTIRKLGVKEQDKVEFDIPALKAKVK